jgi:hypothetical protein
MNQLRTGNSIVHQQEWGCDADDVFRSKFDTKLFHDSKNGQQIASSAKNVGNISMWLLFVVEEIDAKLVDDVEKLFILKNPNGSHCLGMKGKQTPGSYVTLQYRPVDGVIIIHTSVRAPKRFAKDITVDPTELLRMYVAVGKALIDLLHLNHTYSTSFFITIETC